jgi:hypothetical protein
VPDTCASVALAIVCVLSTSACAQSAPNPPPEAQFVGTWQLVSVVTQWPDGRVTAPWGDAPVGRLSYGADGRMSAQLMDARRNQADGRPLVPEFAANAASYFGAFSVDTARGIVRHRVAASLRAVESGTLERAYELRDDSLILRAEAQIDGQAVTHTLVWRRGVATLPAAERP